MAKFRVKWFFKLMALNTKGCKENFSKIMQILCHTLSGVIYAHFVERGDICPCEPLKIFLKKKIEAHGTEYEKRAMLKFYKLFM